MIKMQYLGMSNDAIMLLFWAMHKTEWFHITKPKAMKACGLGSARWRNATNELKYYNCYEVERLMMDDGKVASAMRFSWGEFAEITTKTDLINELQNGD